MAAKCRLFQFISFIIFLHNVNSSTKYILIWTSPRLYDLLTNHLGYGRRSFVQRNCAVTDCYITFDQQYLNDITKFDAVLFDAKVLERDFKNYIPLPLKRSSKQMYIFGTVESPIFYPICNPIFDSYFNLTFTFRLDSDIRWKYVVVRDLKTQNIIGPQKHMKWLKHEEMKPLGLPMRARLRSKSKAAAWIVSNCDAKNDRNIIAYLIDEELRKYNHKLDIYGGCGDLECHGDCHVYLNRDYFFYFSFENSQFEDYVTEKALLPLLSNAVPIVYGGADYTRFLPPGSYINAKEKAPKEIALIIILCMNDFEMYYDFFRWKNHYILHETIDTSETHDACTLCAALHNKKLMNRMQTYKHFREWWTPNYKQLCTDQKQFQDEESLKFYEGNLN